MAVTGTFSSGTIRMDPAKLAQIVREGDGGLVRYMLGLGDQVKSEAQARVGVYAPPPADPDPPPRARPPGQLRDSIVKRLRMSTAGPVVEVGSEDPIALLHHEGTIAHTITASKAPMLVYWSNNLGTRVRRRSVQHPGTQPNRYLTDALAVIAR